MDLKSGLLQFYQGVSNGTHLRSWDESEVLPENLIPEILIQAADGLGGTYQNGDAVSCLIYPYREASGRIYAGLHYRVELETLAGQAIVWLPTESIPLWVTGYTIIRMIGDAYAGFRDQSRATIQSGWTDDGSGWSAASELPFSYSNPPRVAKILWNLLDQYSPPGPFVTVPWSGGFAFSSGYNTQLLRFLSADLRGDLNGTMAFWLQPVEEGVVAAVRGITKYSFKLRCGSSGAAFEFGDSGNVLMNGHQSTDWYLVVLRNDTAANTLTIDVLRQRDLQHGSATLALPADCIPLGSGDDFLNEFAGSVLTIGSPWYPTAPVVATFDRIGLWSRRLRDAEILSLFNGGDGWLPS